MAHVTTVPHGAYPVLQLDDKTFLRQCRFDTYMASGNGGQKRNRTYSAVRLTHSATGVSVIAEESRSQLENRHRAMRRLRMALALSIRNQDAHTLFTVSDQIKPVIQQEPSFQINKKNPLYPLLCATVLDALYVTEGKIGEAAALLKTSTGKLNRFFSRDKNLLTAVNHLRSYFNLKALKAS